MIPVTRLDDGAVAYVECGHCGSIDVTYEHVDYVNEHAGPSDRRRYVTDILSCHAGAGCPEQKMDPLYTAAQRRMPPLDAAPAVSEKTAAARTRFRPSGRRGQVLAALLTGAMDGHQIGAQVGCDHNQVATRAKELEDAGYVHRVGKRQGPRRSKVTIYALTVDGRHLAMQYANTQDRNAA